RPNPSPALRGKWPVRADGGSGSGEAGGDTKRNHLPLAPSSGAGGGIRVESTTASEANCQLLTANSQTKRMPSPQPSPTMGEGMASVVYASTVRSERDSVEAINASPS